MKSQCLAFLGAYDGIPWCGVVLFAVVEACSCTEGVQGSELSDASKTTNFDFFLGGGAEGQS